MSTEHGGGPGSARPDDYDDSYGAAPDDHARALRTRRRRARAGRWLAPVLFLLPPLLLAGFAWSWWQRQMDPPGDPGREIEFVVKRNWGAQQIGDALDDRGIIGSSLAFQWYVRTGGHGPFQAGRFLMHEDEGVRGAVEILEGKALAGPLDVGILRGLRLEQIAEQLAVQIPGTTAKEFLDLARSGAVRSRWLPEGIVSLEGLLGPGQFEIARGARPETVLRQLVERFDSRAEELGLGPPGPTAWDTLVIASLIEKEAVRDDERALVSSVIRNRLVAGMPLQLDASTLYAVGKDGGLTTEADRASDSPYNTYRAVGLPPGPISNVSDASIRAAAQPASSDFLFYVIKDCNGRHAFSRTYEEHLRNVEAAREKGLFGDAC